MLIVLVVSCNKVLHLPSDRTQWFTLQETQYLHPLLGKYYIYSKKCQNGLPTAQGFIARIKLIYSGLELQIARK